MSKKKDKKDIKILQKINPATDWVLGKMLGKGSFGEVYLTEGPNREPCAAKICEIKCEGDYNDMKLEVEILTNCDHQNVLKAKASYYWEKKIWMILELCQGGALDDIVEKLEGFDETTIRAIIFQSLNGLDYLHKRGIIHRDIKAGNLMLTEVGVLKIADFGVSAQMPSPHDYRNTFIGTPYWMAPEAILTESFPNQKYSTKVDIWSLGIAIIEFAEVIPPDCDYNPVQVLLVRTKSPPPTLKEPEKWSSDMNNFVELSLLKDPNRRPSAEKLLSHPWLADDYIRGTEKLVELYQISKAMDCEAEVEVILEDNAANQIDIDLDESNDVDPNRLSDSRDHPVILRTTNERGSISSKSENAKPKEIKTIRKTVHVEINGRTTTKSIIKVVNDDNKGVRERDRSIREKIMNQLKFLKLEEQREQKKLVQGQKNFLQDMLSKQKSEVDSMMDKYRSECDSTFKMMQRELDKRKYALKSDVEKYLKRARANNEKERKIHLKAMKPKNKTKFDILYMDPNYISKLQKLSFENFQKFANPLKEDFQNFHLSLIKHRHEQLSANLANVAITKLGHALELAQLQRGQITATLELVLQQKFKSDAKEHSITNKHMLDKMEDIKQQHLRILRELPKLQRANLKRAMENLKKSLRQQKVKNEKETLQRRQEEMIEQLENEKKNIKEAQDVEIRKLAESNEAQLKEIKQYQIEKSKMTHKMYQELLYKRFLEDEIVFKEVLIQSYELKKLRDADYEVDVESTKHLEMEFIDGVRQESF